MTSNQNLPPANAAELIAALRAELDAKEKHATEQDHNIATLTKSLKTALLERDHYKVQLEARLRALYSAKSEARKDPKQTALLFNEAEALSETTPDDDKVNVAAHRKHKPGRKPLDEHLPREIVRHELAEDERRCPHDNTVMTEIGVDISEQLDIEPATLKVIQHQRVKYACPCCAEGVKQAPAAQQLIPKSLFTANALAWIIISKYQDAVPLYRQATILNRFGGDIARNTLATVVVRCGEAVQAIINLMRDRLMDAAVIHMDETVVQVLKENGRAAQNKSYMWLQRSDNGPPIILFTYAPSRSGKTALDLLDGASGALMSDGYEAYDKAADVRGLVHLACWAHARRKFIEAEDALPKIERGNNHPATQMIKHIAHLYRTEREATENQLTTEQRQHYRHTQNKPVLEQIKTQMERDAAITLPSSLYGKALHYLSGQWIKLNRFIENGDYPLDNNAAENAIRPFVIGRKNWLFSDTVGGAKASANLYSLIGTAKANGLEPYQYLAHLFRELPKTNKVEQLEQLLPWSVQLPRRENNAQVELAVDGVD
jgi:transposase